MEFPLRYLCDTCEITKEIIKIGSDIPAPSLGSPGIEARSIRRVKGAGIYVFTSPQATIPGATSSNRMAILFMVRS